MLGTFISLLESANTIHDSYKRVSGIFKADNSQKETLERIASGIERLSDTILYAPNMESVRDKSRTHQRKIDNLREVRESLEPVQKAIGSEILSSAVILTPDKMLKAMQASPWEVLIDVRPVTLSKQPNNPDLVPVVFQHDGSQYIGWQMRGTLPILFDCEYDDNLVVPSAPSGGIISAVSRLFSGKAKTVESNSGNISSNRLKDGSEGPKMVVIPAGHFRMGDITGNYDNERKPVHKVSVNSFAMGRYPVTVGEFRLFVEATGYKTEAETGDGARVWKDGKWQTVKDANWHNPYFSQTDNHPVVCVSWNDAIAYTEWLSKQMGQPYRLPTEAEWEYAARAGTETDYWWGNEIGKNRANCHNSGSKWSSKSTSPVGSFKPNPFGLYDTVGNVWEWCADNWHENYEGAPTDGSIWKGGDKSRRVLRGGSRGFNPFNCRSANRVRSTSDNRSQDIGFRVAVAAWL